ncbi:hypothetical protein MMC12_002885 [Toensbergia leucococca]|nr:hypothetical protein [Toensbergia leucococca]
MTYLEENWLSGLEPALPTDAFQHPAPWLMSSEMKHEAWKRAESGMMVTCVLCKTKQLAMAFEALDLLNPPTSRLCKQHRKQLVHPNLVLPWDHQRDGETRSWRVTAGPPRRYPLVTPSAAAFQRRWISTMRAMCTHCGKVHDWEPCDCEDVCSTCPTLQVRVYERYKHMQDTQVFEWDFQKERHGTLLVREETFGKTSIFTSERFKSWGSAASRISELYG